MASAALEVDSRGLDGGYGGSAWLAKLREFSQLSNRGKQMSLLQQDPLYRFLVFAMSIFCKTDISSELVEEV